MRYILVALLIAGAAGGGYYVATRTNPPARPPTTTAATRGAIDVTVDLTGSVSAKSSRGLSFGTPGIVATVMFAEGDAVKSNDVIAALNTTAIDAQLKAAQSGLTGAQSALRAAQDALDSAPSPTSRPSPGASVRPTPPPLPGVPSTPQLTANVDAAQAAVDSAQAAIDAAKLAQNGAVIRAPFAGTLTRLLLHVGDYVTPGPIVTAGFPVEVTDAGALQIVAGASEDDVVKLAADQSATVKFDALSNVKLAGKVCEIPTSPTPVQGVPTYPVKVCLDATDPAVRLGLTANVSVVVAHRDNVVLVPSTAIHITGNDHVVNVVRSGNVIVPTTVQVGETDGTNTEITSGLQEGERIETTT